MSRLTSHLRLLPVAWVAGLLALPAILWALGVRQPNVEEATKATSPSISIDSLGHAATYEKLDAFVLGGLPLRDKALEVYGNIKVGLFHESTNPIVALGHRGWLYYAPEIATCTPVGWPLVDPNLAADSADILARTLVASGRNTTVVFAGSKRFTHPDDAPEVPAAVEACTSGLDAIIQDRLGTTPGGLDLRPALNRLERRGEPVFLKNDTHWNWRGREIFVREVLDRVRPGLPQAAGLRPGPEVERAGDLARLMGITRHDRDRALVASRPPPRPPRPGDVLLIGDSQMEKSLLDPTGAPGAPPLRDVLLPGTPYCSWARVESGGCDRQMVRARTVVVEIVTREIVSFATARCWRPLTLVAAAMRGTPGAWLPAAGGVISVDGTLRIPASGAISVTVHPRDGDVSPIPRLVRLPIEHLPPVKAGEARSAVTLSEKPLNGQPAPCATPDLTVTRNALFLPIPAARSAADLVVTVHGPPGTRLGRPETIQLDGRAVVPAPGSDR